LNLAPIEWLIIVALAGMILALAVAEYSGSHARHRDSQRKDDLQLIQTKVTAYYALYARYPLNLSVLSDLPVSACRDPRGRGTCSQPDYTYKAFKGGTPVTPASSANCDNQTTNCDSYSLYTTAMETLPNPYVLSPQP